MDTIAVYVDDAAHARQLLRPMLADGGGTRWVVVGCAPKLTHRIGRWVAHANRRRWRARWMAALRLELAPLFVSGGASRCEWVLACGPLDAVGTRLRGRFGSGLRLLDARRPRLGTDLAPLVGPEPALRWTTPVAVSSGLAVVLALAD